jgi:hypothetical protein
VNPLKGTISDFMPSQFQLKTEKGIVPIKFSEETFFNDSNGDDVPFSRVKNEDRILVYADTLDDNSYVAKNVIIEKPKLLKISGTVTTMNMSYFILQTQNNRNYQVSCNAKTKATYNKIATSIENIFMRDKMEVSFMGFDTDNTVTAIAVAIEKRPE